MPELGKNAPGAKAEPDAGPLDGMASVYVNGKVTITTVRELTDRAYGLGQLDGLAAAVARVRAGLPRHWAEKAVEAIEAPEVTS